MPQSGYDVIAKEYYNSEHVTSRNFDSATRLALQQFPFPCEDGMILELGAGRGRSMEYLAADQLRLVQLDLSEEMLNLDQREPCVLKVLADACKIPLASQQFAYVVGFLVDPFMGLDCLAEAFRMLQNGGQLLLTVPTKEWGDAIRSKLQIDKLTTRFRIIGTERTVLLPSVLHSPNRIYEMLEISGFKEILIHDHPLPENEQTVSPDIMHACDLLGVKLTELPIIHSIRARR